MRAWLRSDSRAGLFLFLLAYATVLLGLLSRLPLTLDEILDLLVLRNHVWHALIGAIPANAGGVPLGYFVRLGFLQLLGESSFSARLSSTIFSLVACFGVFLLARRAGLRWPLLATIVFALFPLQLRYALEARAYSQALCLSIWCTIVFFQWIVRPASIGLALLYTACVIAGLYTQPYTLFVPVAHFLWLLFERRSGLMLARVGAAILVASLAFLPWYIYGAPIWSRGVAAIYPQSTLGPKVILLILRELPDIGYIGSAIVLCGVCVGLYSPSKPQDRKTFWLLYLIVPLLAALAADRAFVYFPAVRQMICVLPPLAILFAAGVEASMQRNAVAGCALAAALLGVSFYEDVHFFFRPRENWQAAADVLATQAAQGSCLIFAPEGTLPLYTYSRPVLAQHQCAPGALANAASVAVALNPSDFAKTAAPIERQLRESGFTQQAELNPAGPRILIYSRSAPQGAK